jgi:hypothetical protein
MGLESSMTSLRANLMAKLKGFMTDRTVLVTEQLSLGNSKVDKQRMEAIAGQLADLTAKTDSAARCAVNNTAPGIIDSPQPLSQLSRRSSD